MIKYKVAVLLVIFSAHVESKTCNVRYFGEENVGNKSVCVCDSEKCDDVPEILGNLTDQQYQIYTTTQLKLGFYSKTGQFGGSDYCTPNKLVINRNVKKQTMVGFGGSITDSFAFLVLSLPEAAQEHLLNSYFGKSGIEYSICRIPIGGTDFSPKAYSYADEPSDDLSNFALQEEDFKHKIPVMKRAVSIKGSDELKFLASAWTAPPWMKTNGHWQAIGVLKKQYYQLWADYHLKFFEEYDKQGLKFWALTSGNEPSTGFIDPGLFELNAMGWVPETQGPWIENNLGPTLKNNSKFSHLKLFVHDDNRFNLPSLPRLLRRDKALEYIDGVAVHWYFDNYFPASWLELTKSPKKDLGTEACSGAGHKFGIEEPVSIGNWTRGENYVRNIFQDLSYGGVGWIDWNMALNETGGPVYIDNPVDAPILVNTAAGEFYKQPMFYAMGHFSKFVVPNSVALEAKLEIRDESNKDVLAGVFLRPDDKIAVILFNGGSKPINIDLEDSTRSTTLSLDPHSINTLLYTS